MAGQESKLFFWVFLLLLGVICFTSLYVFRPIIDGDGLGYAQTMAVLEGGPVTPNFVPNRIITTILGLAVIILLTKVFGSLLVGWLVLNVLFYFGLNIIFYRLTLAIFRSSPTAFLAGLFLASNYALISFGLDYWLDIGGWFFYLLALAGTWRYLETGQNKFVIYSAVAIGVGGLFKEYAFLAVIPIAVVLFYQSWPRLTKIFAQALGPALITLLPVSVVSYYVYRHYHYTYATWLLTNQAHYIYSSRLVEYVKSLGSLYNVLAFLVLGGAYYFIRPSQMITPERKTRLFIIAVILSVLPIFIWPAITQRILFITVPAALWVAAFLFKKLESRWYWFVPVLVIYIAASFLMDAFILTHVNLPF